MPSPPPPRPGAECPWAALASGLDEALVMFVPVADEAVERARLMRLLGAL